MPRWLRLALIVLAGIATLTVAAAVLLAVTFDPNTQKQRIIEAVYRATGRDLTLDGPLRLSMGLTPELTAENATLSNMPDGSRPAMVTVARLAAKVRLVPLLWRHVEIATLSLDHPDILIETDAAGQGNWRFQPPAPAATPEPPATPASLTGVRTTTAVDRITVTDGHLTWRDGETGRIRTIAVPQAVVTLADGIRLVADLQSAGQSVHTVTTLRPHDSGPAQLTLVADGAAGLHAALDGTLAQPPSAQSYRGRVEAQIPDLSTMAALLGVPALPALHDVRLGMTVGEGAPFTPLDLSLHIGHSDLAPQRPGAILTQLDLTLPAMGQPGHVTAEGTVRGGAVHLASGITLSPARLVLTGLDLTAPGSKLGGALTLSHEQRWALNGALSAASIDADGLTAMLEPAPTATPAPAAASAPAPKAVKSSAVFSDAILPWDVLQAGDADLTLTAATLRARGIEYRNLSTHVALQAGSLHLDPFTVQTPAGEIAGSASLDAAPPEPTATLQVHAASLALGVLLQAAGLPGASDSPIEMDADLNSSGRSPHDLAAHLDGHAGFAMVDGTVPNAAIAALLGGLIPPGAGHLDLGGRSAVRCLALRLDARAGQVKLAALTLDTPRLDLDGTGTINLDDETLALRLHPTMRLGPTNIGAPVRVDGTLRRPVTILDDMGAGGRSGIVIGGAAPADDCAAQLKLARNGAAGPMPAPAKSPKAADLLRSLLR